MTRKDFTGPLSIAVVAEDLSDRFIERLNACLIKLPRMKQSWYAKRLAGELDRGQWEPLAQVRALAPITGLARRDLVALLEGIDAGESPAIPCPELHLIGNEKGGK